VAREVQYPSLQARLDTPEFYVPFIDVRWSSHLEHRRAARCRSQVNSGFELVKIWATNLRSFIPRRLSTVAWP
jgi:hypothetical protein